VPVVSVLNKLKNKELLAAFVKRVLIVLAAEVEMLGMSESR